MSITLKNVDGQIEHFENFDELTEYGKEYTSLYYAINIKKYMRENNIKIKDIATKINKTSAYVSRALGKGQNLTIGSMVELALSMNCAIDIKIIKNSVIDHDRKIHNHINWVLKNGKDDAADVEQTANASSNTNDNWEAFCATGAQSGN